MLSNNNTVPICIVVVYALVRVSSTRMEWKANPALSLSWEQSDTADTSLYTASMDNAAIFPILLAGTQQTVPSLSARGRISNRLEFRLCGGW
ncbi:hypothetical protein CI102_14726 [Trichoderma harzianum]|nr:hypothetical protein CI102_14726 [Trichoderma harzianum]